MRDADYNLASGAYRAFQELPNFSDQQKQDYKYLRTKFENADTGSLKQWMRAAADIGVDVATDPTMILSALMVPFTGGASLGSRVAAGEATKLGLKRIGKSFARDESKPVIEVLKNEGLWLKKGGLQNLKQKRAKAIKDYYKSDVKTNAIIAATEGAVFSGVGEYLKQEQDDVDGINLRYGLDYFDIGASTALGAIAGGVLGGGISKIQQKFDPEVRRTIEKFSDEKLLDESDAAYKAARAGEYALSVTIGKPTTRFKTLSKNSPTLARLLTRFRYDTFKGDEGIGFDEDLLEAARKGETPTNRSYKQVFDATAGRYNLGYEDAIRPLTKKGKLRAEDNELLNVMMRDKELEKLFVDPTRNQKETQEAFIKRRNSIRAIQDKKAMDLYSIEGANENHFNAIRKLRKLSNQVLDEAAEVGIYRRKLKRGPNAWFSRRWKRNVIEENRNELATIMVDQNAIGLSDEIILQYLPKAQQQQYNELMQYGKVYEDLVTNFEKLPTTEIQKRINALDVKFRPESKRMDGTPEALVDMLHELQERKLELSRALPDNSTLRAEKFKVANDIIDGMLDKRNVINDVDSEVSTTMTPSSFSARNLYMLDDRSIAKFLDDDFDSMMRDYFNNSSRVIARKQLFGINTEEFSRRYLDNIREELQQKGSTLSEKDRADLVALYENATGIKAGTFENVLGQRASDYAKLSQQVAHLPLATLSSLTEAFIPLTRVSTGTYLKGIGQAVKSWSRSNYDDTMKILQSEHNLTKDEANREMHRVYLGLEQAVAQRIDSIAGEGVQDPTARKLQNLFFKTNLLSQWTRTVQLASFTMGKDLITRNLKTVSEMQGKQLTKGQKRKLNSATQELFDLGINIKQGVEWVNSGAKKYSNDVDVDTGLKRWNMFYERNVMEGASRFASEVILDPSKSSVTRPHIQTSAIGSILFQFLGYPTAFGNTVLKNYYTQIKRQPVVGTARVGATALFMTGVATGLNAIRSGGESLEKEPDEIILDSVARWGGTGFGEYIRNAQQNAEIGGGIVGTAAKAVSGPVVGDAVDAILYRKGPAEIVATNVPFYSAIPSDYRKEFIKAPAREIDYSLGVGLGLRKPRQEPSLYSEFGAPYKEFKKAYDRDRNFEGGVIDRIIERAGENPSARIDRLTGTSYEDQAGAILENRKSFRLGGFLRRGIEAYMSKSNKPVTREELEADPLFQQLSPMLGRMKTVDDEAVLADINSGMALQYTPQEQTFYTSSFIENSVEPKDVYTVLSEDVDSGLYGRRMGTQTAKELEAQKVDAPALSKNKIRIRNPLKLTKGLPTVPMNLIYDTEFLKTVQNKKAFKSLRKDIDSKVKLVMGLDDSKSLFDKRLIRNEIFTSGNKDFYDLLEREGYDAIEYTGPELKQSKLSSKDAQVDPFYQTPAVYTALGKDSAGSKGVQEANEAGGFADYLKDLEAEGLKDPREADAGFSIEEDVVEALPEDTRPMFLPVFDLEGSELEKQLSTTAGRFNKQYLVFRNEQVLPFGKTEVPTNKEINYVNSIPLEKRISFIVENHVGDKAVDPLAIKQTLENEGVFNLVSTGNNEGLGKIISYKQVTTGLIDDLRNKVDDNTAQTLESLNKAIIEAEQKRAKGFQEKVGRTNKTRKFILPESFYVQIVMEPGSDTVNVSKALTLPETIEEIKTTPELWYHPKDNNVLSGAARRWRILNSEDANLKQYITPTTEQLETRQENVGKVLGSLQQKRGLQYSGKFDKDLESQKEEAEVREIFNPQGGEDPETLSEGSTIEKASYANRFSKGVTSKQRFDLEQTKEFLEKNPEFLDDDNFTAQQPETYIETTPPRSKIILPSLIPENEQVEIKPFKYEEGKKAWAHYSKNNNTIYIDKNELEKRYKDKAWENPKVKGVKPLPENAITSLEVWKNFVYAHEKSHVVNLRRENESLADYENRTNEIALADLIYQKEMARRNKKFKGGVVLQALKRKVINV
jgi:hypothetical protein